MCALLVSCDGNSLPRKTDRQALEIGSNESLSLTNGERLHFIWIESIGIWVGQSEVTLDQLKVMSRSVNKHPDSHAPRYAGNENDLNVYPAVMVSWGLAKEVCDKLNRKYENLLPAGYTFRLPTEAEWEHFARCGKDWVYPWGNALPSVAPADKASGANPWGIYGIANSVSEWCEGWYDESNKLRLLKGASAYTGFEISSRGRVEGQSPIRGLFLWGTVRNQGNKGTGFRIVIGLDVGE